MQRMRLSGIAAMPGFMTGCTVNIEALANQYRTNFNREPAVLIDGSNCLHVHYLHKNHLNYLMGGQLLEFVILVKLLVLNFKAIGVKVVFYFDGNVGAKGKYRKINEITLKSVEKRFEILHKDVAGVTRADTSYLDHKWLMPALVVATAKFMIRHECGVEVRTSVGACVPEMASYCRSESLFAIMSDNPELIFFEGAMHVFRLTSLQQKSMRVNMYHRHALAQIIKLDVEQLPLWASLIGNSVIKATRLDEFHKRIGDCSDVQRLTPTMYFKPVAAFIKSLPSVNLDNIAMEVFRDQNMSARLSESIDYYSNKDSVVVDDVEGDENWRNILKAARKKHEKSDVVRTFYPVMTGCPYQLGIVLEDLANEDVVPAAELLSPLRRRTYALMFHEKPVKEDVEECCVYGYQDHDKPRRVPISAWSQVCPDPHPGLLKLWDDEATPVTERWKLLAQVVSPDLNNDNFLRLRPHHKMVTAVLFYLVHLQESQGRMSGKVVITPEQVKAVIVHVLTLEGCRGCVGTLARHIDTGAWASAGDVHLSTVLGLAVTTMLFLVAACGINMASVLPHQYFDGLLLKTVLHDTDKFCQDQETREALKAIENIVYYRTVCSRKRELEGAEETSPAKRQNWFKPECDACAVQ